MLFYLNLCFCSSNLFYRAKSGNILGDNNDKVNYKDTPDLNAHGSYGLMY